MWDTANAFVCMLGDSRYCVWIPDLSLLFLSNLLQSSIFRPLPRLKPFPHRQTPVIPPLRIIALVLLINNHNSYLSYSLLSLPTLTQPWVYINEFFYCKLKWGRPRGGSALACQVLASGFWSSLDKREKKVTIQTNRKQSTHDKSNFRACQHVNWSDTFLPTMPKGK